MRRGQYGLLVALASVWGLSYVFYRVGAPALGPALFVELRVLTAGGVLAAYLVARVGLADSWRRIRRQGREYLVLGALNAAVPFTLIAFGELTLPASFASVLNATAPSSRRSSGSRCSGSRYPAGRPRASLPGSSASPSWSARLPFRSRSRSRSRSA
jgi:hypothetical protein